LRPFDWHLRLMLASPERQQNKRVARPSRSPFVVRAKPSGIRPSFTSTQRPFDLLDLRDGVGR
jgi:hypothetical protein